MSTLIFEEVSASHAFDFFSEKPEMAHFQFFNPEAPRNYLVAKSNGKVVGLVCYVESSFVAPHCYGIAYVETVLKNQGIATQLCEKFFNKAKKLNKGIRATSYEPEGRLYLKKVLQRLSQEKEVELVETN